MTTIDQSALAPALSRCAQIANNTHPIPALQTIRIGSSQNELVLEANNGISDISESVPCDKEMDVVCVSGSRFNNIIQSMIGGIELAINKNHLLISDGFSKVKLPLAGLEEFPQAQAGSFKAQGLSCPDLAKAIHTVAGFASVNLGRPNLNGVQIISNSKQLIAIATDGACVAVHEQALIGAETRFLIPNQPIHEVVKALEREGAVLEQGENSVRIHHKSGHFSFRLLELKFPVEQIGQIQRSDLTKLGQIEPENVQEPLGLILACSSDKRSVNVDLGFNKAGLNISHAGPELDFDRLIPGQYPDNLTRVDGKRLNKVLSALDGTTEVSTFNAGLCFKNKDLTVFLFGIIQA